MKAILRTADGATCVIDISKRLPKIERVCLYKQSFADQTIPAMPSFKRRTYEFTNSGDLFGEQVLLYTEMEG